MTEENTELLPSTPFEPLGPRAIAHYYSWAAIFMERYLAAHPGKSSGEHKDEVRNEVMKYTRRMKHFAHEIYDLAVAAGADNEDAVFSSYAVDTKNAEGSHANLNALPGYAALTHQLARWVLNEDPFTPDGKPGPDHQPPEEKELNKANFQKLLNGLEYALQTLGTCRAEHKMAGPVVSRTPPYGIDYQKNIITTTQGLAKQYSNRLRKGEQPTGTREPRSQTMPFEYVSSATQLYFDAYEIYEKAWYAAKMRGVGEGRIGPSGAGGSLTTG